MSNRHAHLLRAKPREYLFPYDFLAEAVKYFNWCDDNPLLEEKVFQHKGFIVRADVDKVRPYTKTGLCTFLAIPDSRLATYAGKGEEWQAALALVEQTIYTQKFENAAANLLNATFISRDLGMADKQELSGPNGGPIQTEGTTACERISSKLASLAARSAEDSDTPGDDA